MIKKLASNYHFLLTRIIIRQSHILVNKNMSTGHCQRSVAIYINSDILHEIARRVLTTKL